MTARAHGQRDLLMEFTDALLSLHLEAQRQLLLFLEIGFRSLQLSAASGSPGDTLRRLCQAMEASAHFWSAAARLAIFR